MTEDHDTGLVALLSGEEKEYTIKFGAGAYGHGVFSGDRAHGAGLFNDGFLRGFCSVRGLRYVGATVVSPWVRNDGSGPEDGDTAVVPVSLKKPLGWYENHPSYDRASRRLVDVAVKMRKVSASLGSVLPWRDYPQDNQVWYRLGVLLGEGLAEEAEFEYHFNEDNGLLSGTSPARTLGEAVAYIDLPSLKSDSVAPWERDSLFKLPQTLIREGLDVPQPAFSDRGSYLLNPLLWSTSYKTHSSITYDPADRASRPPVLDSYSVDSDPFMPSFWGNVKSGTVVAAFGDWRRAFTIVDSGHVTIRLARDTLTAETVTGGSATPPQLVQKGVGGYGSSQQCHRQKQQTHSLPKFVHTYGLLVGN